VDFIHGQNTDFMPYWRHSKEQIKILYLKCVSTVLLKIYKHENLSVQISCILHQFEKTTSVADLHQCDADPDHSGLLEAPQFPNFSFDADPQQCFY
jgi:hypothetical protein